MTIIIDGMDSNKLLVPNLQRPSKDLDSANATKLGLMGVKVVCGQVHQYMYLSSGRFSKNANGPWNALIDALVKHKERGIPLPENLSLQLDNCPSENKSVAIYILFASLVGLGVFKTVTVNYLIVGHTHEDIDQIFSTLSRYINNVDLYTPADMLEVRRFTLSRS